MGHHALQAEVTFARRGLQWVLELLQQLGAGEGINTRRCHGGQLGPEYLRTQHSGTVLHGICPSLSVPTERALRRVPREPMSLCSRVQARR